MWAKQLLVLSAGSFTLACLGIEDFQALLAEIMTQIKALGKLVVSLGLASIVSAMNDWSTPCLQGICSYDVPKSDTSMAAKFIIVRAPHSLIVN